MSDQYEKPTIAYVDTMGTYKPHEPQEIPPNFLQCERCKTYHLRLYSVVHCENCSDILKLPKQKKTMPNKAGRKTKYLKGVSYHKVNRYNPWVARYDGMHIGSFPTEQLAHEAYLKEAMNNPALMDETNKMDQPNNIDQGTDTSQGSQAILAT